MGELTSKLKKIKNKCTKCGSDITPFNYKKHKGICYSCFMIKKCKR